MKRRLRIYGFGMGLGLLLAWALFLRGRNTTNYTAWTPNSRILEEIRLDNTLDFPDNFWCEMKCVGFSSIEFENLLVDGDVKFSDSQVETWPRMYRVEFKTDDNGTLVLDFSKSEMKHFSIIKVAKKGENIECDC